MVSPSISSLKGHGGDFVFFHALLSLHSHSPHTSYKSSTLYLFLLSSFLPHPTHSLTLFSSSCHHSFLTPPIPLTLFPFPSKEPGGVLVFLPGQDDIEALQSLLEDNLPAVVGQQYEVETLDPTLDFKGSSRLSHAEGKDNEEDGVMRALGVKGEKVGEKVRDVHGEKGVKEEKGVTGVSVPVATTRGLLTDFEIRPLYAAMPPEEQVD